MVFILFQAEGRKEKRERLKDRMTERLKGGKKINHKGRKVCTKNTEGERSLRQAQDDKGKGRNHCLNR